MDNMAKMSTATMATMPFLSALKWTTSYSAKKHLTLDFSQVNLGSQREVPLISKFPNSVSMNFNFEGWLV